MKKMIIAGLALLIALSVNSANAALEAKDLRKEVAVALELAKKDGVKGEVAARHINRMRGDLTAKADPASLARLIKAAEANADIMKALEKISLKVKEDTDNGVKIDVNQDALIVASLEALSNVGGLKGNLDAAERPKTLGGEMTQTDVLVLIAGAGLELVFKGDEASRINLLSILNEFNTLCSTQIGKKGQMHADDVVAAAKNAVAKAEKIGKFTVDLEALFKLCKKLLKA